MSYQSSQIDFKELDIIVRELKRVVGNDIDGDVAEFGCYLGATSIILARTLKSIGKDRLLYVYDSFAGLPEKTRQDFSPLGVNFKAGELLASKKQFIKNMLQAGVPMPRIKKAWFSELKSDDLPKKVAFAFLDGDYYASIVDSLRLLEPILASGSTIVVDDYANSSLPGVARAVDEWLSRHPASKKVEQSLAIIYIRG